MIYTMEEKQLHEKLYISAYVIFIIKTVLNASELIRLPGIVDSLLILIFFFCIGCKLLTQRYSVEILLLSGLFGIVYVYSSLVAKYYILFFSFLCICALQDVDIRTVLKVSVRIKIIALSIHVIAYIVLYLLNPETITYYYRNGERRINFLLGHPNLFMGYLVWTCLEILYLRYNQIKKSELLLMWLINTVFYKFTDSNTGTLVLSGVILMVLIEKKNWRITGRAISIFSRYGYVACSILFPSIVAVYTKLNGALLTLWNSFNNYLTGRLFYGAYAYEAYQFTLFGRNIRFPSLVYWRGTWLDYILFDNSYLWLFIIFGSVHLMILSGSLFVVERKTTPVEKILLIAFTLYGIMENYALDVSVCFPLLFIGKYFMNTGKLEENINV